MLRQFSAQLFISGLLALGSFSLLSACSDSESAVVLSTTTTFSPPTTASRTTTTIRLPPSTTTTTTRPATHLPTGSWGGTEIQMLVSDNNATLQFSCAHGAIPYAIFLDSRNRFDVMGTITIEHGGPTTPGEVFPTFPTRYQGLVSGRTQLTLQVTYIDQNRKTVEQSFTLKLGQEGTLHRCQ